MKRFSPGHLGASSLLASSLLASLSLAASLGAGCDGGANPGTPPAGSTLLAEGTVELLGDQIGSCSHQPPARAGGVAPERWCAFARGHAPGEPAALWVVNLDRARTGQAPCDGSSPHCLQLTTNLWTGDPVFSPSHPRLHGFFGDTLFFYTDSTSGNGDDAFEGIVQAWRPGMTQGRVISGAKGYYCFGHERTAAAVCLTNQGNVPVAGSTSSALEFDLLAGSVEGGPVGALPLIERIRPYDPGGELVWGASFSPTGEYFAFATKVPDAPAAQPGAPALQRLRVVRSTELGVTAPREIMRDLARWTIAPDGTKIFFLRNVSTDANNESSGTLHMADFPSGENLVTLAQSVGGYEVYGRPGQPVQALGLYQNPQADHASFRLMRDLSQPGNLVTVADQIDDALVSPDLRFAYYQDSDAEGETISVIARTDGTGKCQLNQNKGRTAFSVSFLPAWGRVAWVEDAGGATGPGSNFEGWLGDPASCTPLQRFSTNLGYYDSTRDGIIYGEPDAPGTTMALRYAPFNSTGVDLAKANLLTSRAGLTTAFVDTRYLVYTVAAATAAGVAPGLFVHGPLR